MAITKVSRGLLSTGVSDSSDATAITIDSSERVGIGTSSPDSPLEIDGGSSANTVLHLTSTTANTFLKISDSNTNEGNFIGCTTDDLTFFTRNSERLRISSTGLVSIGTTTTDRELKVQKSSDHSIIAAVSGTSSLAGMVMGDTSDDDRGAVLYNNNGDYLYFQANAVQYGQFNSTGEFHVTSGGNAIAPTIKHGGATGDVAKIRAINRSGQGADKGGVLELGAVTDDGVSRSDVFGSVAGLKTNATSANREGYLQFSTSSGSALSERMRIESGGSIFIGTSSAVRGSERVSIDCPDNEDGIVVATPSAGLIVRKDSFSNGFLCLFETSGGSAVGSITSDGTNTTFSTSSDARLKDITGEARGLEVINKLNPVAYNWKESGKADEGLIAQEVMDIVPNAVIGSEEEMYQMDYSKLVTPLVKAIQELTAEVEELKTKLESK